MITSINYFLPQSTWQTKDLIDQLKDTGGGVGQTGDLQDWVVSTFQELDHITIIEMKFFLWVI